MSLSTFTVVHVVLSLVGIASGVLVLLRPSASPKAWGLTTLFLATTLPPASRACSTFWRSPASAWATGSASPRCWSSSRPAGSLAPSAGRPRRATYVAGAATLLYLNAFIAVMQAFAKIGFLRALPGTSIGSPPFLAHLLVLAVSVWLAFHAFAHLQPGTSAASQARPRRTKPLRVADRWG